jgi:hypothetical protein
MAPRLRCTGATFGEELMWRSMAKTAFATSLFGLVHSAVASAPFKRRAEQLLGKRHRNGFFRLFYNLQAVLTFAALVVYIWRLPNRVLYCVRGPLRWLMHIGQVAGALFALWGMYHVGIFRMAGVTSLLSWLSSRNTGQEVEPEPDGQGPRLDDDGTMKATGPYKFSRHALNFALLPIFWLVPKMTTNLFAFNTVMTLYAWLGSLHEEVRLRETYGRAYEGYQQSGTPFFVPRP